MTDKEMQIMKDGLETLGRIRAQMEDLQRVVERLFFMTEKHQAELIQILKQK